MGGRGYRNIFYGVIENILLWLDIEYLLFFLPEKLSDAIMGGRLRRPGGLRPPLEAKREMSRITVFESGYRNILL